MYYFAIRRRGGRGKRDALCKTWGREVITAAISSLFSRLLSDVRLGRLWEKLSEDRIFREKQQLVDLLCSAAGGPMACASHEMLLSYRGMGISSSDWELFRGHLDIVFELFEVGEAERDEVSVLIEDVKEKIVR